MDNTVKITKTWYFRFNEKGKREHCIYVETQQHVEDDGREWLMLHAAVAV